MPPPNRVSSSPRAAAARTVTPFPPVVPRGGSADRINAQLRTRLQALAQTPLSSTFDLPGGHRATATTTLTVTDASPPQVRATVVLTLSAELDSRLRSEYQGQIRSNTAGMVRRALADRDLAPGYLAGVDVRWSTR
jgi:hypothetical protein